MKNTVISLLLMALVLFGTAGLSQAGVRQRRSVDSMTNVGTNPYADLNSNSGYGTVNPNYSDRATVYHGENGTVAVAPGGAAVVGENGAAVYNGYGAVVTGGYYYDYNSYADTAPVGAQIPIGTILEYVPSSAVPLMVQGTRYYYADNIYLAEVFDGNAVVYQVVPAPLGAVVTMLPAGCAVQNYNGKSFTVCGNTTYRQVAGGYEVVALN